MASEYVCARCGVSVGVWFFGWKHQTGWRGPKACGQKPIPILRTDYKPPLKGATP